MFFFLFDLKEQNQSTENQNRFEKIVNLCCIFREAYVRVIPHGTVDNNLGQDHLAGPKALDPNYYRQPTL